MDLRDAPAQRVESTRRRVCPASTSRVPPARAATRARARTPARRRHTSAARRPIRSGACRRELERGASTARDRRHSDATAAEEAVSAVAQPAPEVRGMPRRRRGSPPTARRRRGPRARRRDRRTQAAALDPALRRDRQRLAAPAVEHGERASCAASRRRSVCSQRGRGRHLQRHFGDEAEDAQRAAQQPRDIEAGDVLHHLAAEAAAPRRCHRSASRRARNRAPRRPAGAADRTGRRRSRRRSSDRLPKAGGSNARNCPWRREQRLDLRQRRAAARRDHQLGRLVVDDAAVRAQIEQLALAGARRRSPWCRPPADARASRRGWRR